MVGCKSTCTLSRVEQDNRRSLLCLLSTKEGPWATWPRGTRTSTRAEGTVVATRKPMNEERNNQ
jgi:hypothetical protein